jgi:hypothetical protein
MKKSLIVWKTGMGFNLLNAIVTYFKIMGLRLFVNN